MSIDADDVSVEIGISGSCDSSGSYVQSGIIVGDDSTCSDFKIKSKYRELKLFHCIVCKHWEGPEYYETAEFIKNMLKSLDIKCKPPEKEKKKKKSKPYNRFADMDV